VTRSGRPAANGNRESQDGARGESIDAVGAALREIHQAASGFGVFALDETGRVVTWNPAAQEQCGYTSSRILGRHISCLYRAAGGADEQSAADALGLALAHGRFEGQASCERDDGTSFRVNMVILAVRDATGKHCGFACQLRDVSVGNDTQRELETRLRQQEGISELGARSLEGSTLQELMTQASMVTTAGLKADFSAVLELDKDGYNLTLKSTSDPDPGAYVGMKMPGGKYSLAGYTLIASEPVISEDLRSESRFEPSAGLIAYGARSGLSVAIKSGGEALGVVASFTRERRTFSQHDINFMQATANILASAMERAATQERLRYSEDFLRTVIESSNDVIVVLDRESTIRFISGSGEAMLGRTVAEMIGRKGMEFCHPDDIPIRQRIFDEALAQPGVTMSAEIRVRLANDTYLESDVGMRALTEIGGAPGVLVNIRDISARKRVAVELAGARDAALESSRLKSAFLANMSHEFRTPLNIILGYNDLIGEHLVEMRDSSQAECVEAVARACKRLLGTLNAVLDYSKFESRAFQLNPQKFRPVPLIRQLIAEMMPRVSKKGLTLAFEFDDEAVTIAFDEYCLTQALHNLLDNAIKFTDHGSATVRLHRDDEGDLCLGVMDTGIGIDAAFQPHLLEPFSQEDCGIARRFEGAGLGLALTRRYLELNGATLSVRSDKGVGSTFTIHFSKTATGPVMDDRGNGTKPSRVGAPYQPGNEPTVLVVEDDPDNRTLMRAMMRNRYRMLSAASPAEVRRQIELYPGTIHLVLMDVGLRGAEDGLALTRSLRTLERFRTTPIVALTGHAMSVNRDQALAAGCDDFFVKPVDRARLFAAIEHLLRRLPAGITVEQPSVS
jgi:PAS domain S-box-containing protein